MKQTIQNRQKQILVIVNWQQNKLISRYDDLEEVKVFLASLIKMYTQNVFIWLYNVNHGYKSIKSIFVALLTGWPAKINKQK